MSRRHADYHHACLCYWIVIDKLQLKLRFASTHDTFCFSEYYGAQCNCHTLHLLKRYVSVVRTEVRPHSVSYVFLKSVKTHILFAVACWRFHVSFAIENWAQRLVLCLQFKEDFIARIQIAYHCHGVEQHYTCIAVVQPNEGILRSFRELQAVHLLGVLRNLWTSVVHRYLDNLCNDSDFYRSSICSLSSPSA